MSPRTARLIRPFMVITLLIGNIVVTGPVGFVQAATYTVTVNDTTDTVHSPGCATIGTGTCSLRDAIIYANTRPTDTGTITLAAATYTLTIPPNLQNTQSDATTGDLDLMASVTINGVGAGSTIIQASATDSTAGIDRVFAIGNSSMPTTVIISGITIRNGRRTSDQFSGIGGSGGGIFVGARSTVTLNDCIISGNAVFKPSSSSIGILGAGIDNAGTLTLSNTTVSSNNASGSYAPGGGIYNDNTLTLTNSTITGNTSSNGGGIYNGSGRSLMLTNSTISGNVASNGAGIYNNGTLIAMSTTIDSNVAAGFGGAVMNGTPPSSIVTLTNTILSNNTAIKGAGIYTGSGSPMALINSTVRDNTASSAGGGIYNTFGAKLTLTGSTLSGNHVSAGDGGGIYTNQAQITMSNSTVSGNGASGSGGAIYSDSFGTITFSASTIVSNNSGIFNNGFSSISLANSLLANATTNCTGTFSSNDYNLSSDGSCTAFTQLHDLQSVNPYVGLLANNGGPTQTHALMSGSPAIDRIPGAGGCSVNISTDQRGISRPQPSGSMCDVGAYEYQPVAPTIGTPTPNSGKTPGGTNVTISGTNFQTGSIVRFDSAQATVIAVAPDGTSITVTTPPHAVGQVSISVTNPGLTAVTQTSAYEYQPLVPMIGQVTPNTGTTLGGTLVTIAGTDFGPGATMTFGGVSATNVIVVNLMKITATVPAHGVGGVSVVVTNTDMSSVSLPNGYIYQNPTVTAVSPSSGSIAGGTQVTISGTNFGIGATVKFGSVFATNIVVVNPTTITATVPAHVAGTVNVDVTNTDISSGSLPSGYTYGVATTLPIPPPAGPLGGSPNPIPNRSLPSVPPAGGPPNPLPPTR